MRQLFFVGILVAGLIAGVLYVLWTILASLYHDWSLGRGVDKIQEESDARRRQRRQEDEARLDNGCEHDFSEGFGGFPPDTCHRCGLQRQRPSGPCDHVWKFANEAVPCSNCEKCGKKYVGSAGFGSP